MSNISNFAPEGQGKERYLQQKMSRDEVESVRKVVSLFVMFKIKIKACEGVKRGVYFGK